MTSNILTVLIPSIIFFIISIIVIDEIINQLQEINNIISIYFTINQIISITWMKVSRDIHIIDDITAYNNELEFNIFVKLPITFLLEQLAEKVK
jgi:hypothetical protein